MKKPRKKITVPASAVNVAPSGTIGIVGKSFKVWANPTTIKFDGKVLARISEQIYLVEVAVYQETGKPAPDAVQHLVPLASMMAGSLERGTGVWEFSDD